MKVDLEEEDIVILKNHLLWISNKTMENILGTTEQRKAILKKLNTIDTMHYGV